MACLAQLVNVIAPIRTLDGGPAWRQTTFFPFRDAARHGRGTVLRVEPDAPTYSTEGDDAVSVLEATAVHGGDTLTVFAVNRDTEPLALVGGPALRGERASSTPCWPTTDPRGGQHRRAARAGSSRARVDGARIDGERLRATLPPRSWNVLRLRV